MATPSTEPEPGAVLAGFDGSDESRAAVQWAAVEAGARGKELVIVQSFEWAVPMLPESDQRVREHSQEQLAGIGEEIRQANQDLSVRTRMAEGPPEKTLPEVADELEPALLVVGSSGVGALSRAVLGSTAAELVNTVRRPVVVVRGEPATDESAPVVVGMDGSDTSDLAVEFALDFADRHGVPVRAVHALSDVPMLLPVGQTPLPYGVDQHSEMTQEVIELRLERLRKGYPGVHVESDVVANRPSAALMDRATGARLLVVGSHGRGRLDRILLGSVSHAAIYHSPCPVAVVRDGSNEAT